MNDMSSLNSICFICLHQGLHDRINLETVVHNDAQNVNTVTEIKYVLPELTILLDPEIPVYICYSCQSTLHSFYMFKKRCLDNYGRLIRNTKRLQDTSNTQGQKINELETRIYNSKPISKPVIKQEQDVHMEINIEEENEDSLVLSEEQEAQKTVEEEVIESEDSVDQQCFRPVEFIKCEAVSDNEQDAGSSSEDEIQLNQEDDALSLCTDVADAGNTAALNSLPEKSKWRYEKAYEEFLAWCKCKKVKSYTENVLLAYFSQKSTCCNAPTLWSYYSMVKATLIIHDNVDISKYSKLVAYLKRKNDGYKPKKPKSLSREQIEKFISKAPDDTYLMMKVAVIFGIAGACSREALSQLIIDDIQNTGSALLVTIRESSKTHRMFTVVDNKEKSLNFVEIFRKYIALRPPHTDHNRLFVFYKNGKCSTQAVGKNTLGKIPKEIATYLKLPDAKSYTGHCFRRSSASLLADTVAPAYSI